MISAIIPAFNEAERIGGTIEGVKSIQGIDEILVIDDGSTDRTAELAEKSGATVIRQPTNLGKGAALNRGAEAAHGNILLLLDADLGNGSHEGSSLLKAVLNGTADMSIASFPIIPGKGGGIGLVVRLARWGILRATGEKMASPLSGQRALKREVWLRIGGFEKGFGAEVALTIDTLAAGFKIVEVPVDMTHRVTGRDWSAVTHRSRQRFAVARALWKRRGIRK